MLGGVIIYIMISLFGYIKEKGKKCVCDFWIIYIIVVIDISMYNVLLFKNI